MGRSDRAPSTLDTLAVITNANIMVGNPTDWSVLLVNPAKKTCNSFEESSVLLYECPITRLGVCLPFSNFEVAVMNHLKVYPLQLHPRVWAYKKVFKL